MQLGIINGVYADKGYNHLKTLELAAGKHPDYPDLKVDVVQVYLNSDNIRDESLLNQIKDTSKELGMELITHIHGLPSKNELGQILHAHGIVLNQQENKRMVIHYNPELRDELFQRSNDLGITPYIENFHKGIVDPDELKKHEDFVRHISESQYNIGAVLDVGRYFVINQRYKKPPEIKNKIIETYKKFIKIKIPVFFHTIGSKTYQQQRENWTSPGDKEDLIPQKNILREILSINKTKGPLILESEKLTDVVKGIEFFKKF